MTFDELNLTKPYLRALADLGFNNPTPIQEKAFPVIMSGKDVVAISQTGTGKTLAYLLPTLRQLTFSEQRQPRVIIIVPTRELVVQVVSEIEKLCQYSTVRYGGIYGGANINPQKQMIYDGLDILVATPGRLMDMILGRNLLVHSIQKLIIDEVDEMLNLGFRTQLLQIMDTLPPKRQNLMFSATLDEDVEKLIENYFYKPNYLELVTRGTPLAKIIQQAYYIPNFYSKVNLLEYLLKHDTSLKKVLVFTKSKKLADALFKELSEIFETEIGIIHSNKTQPQRFEAIANFENATHRVLIATDIIARGLDIPEVTHVINFDTPNIAEDYIHRIGRTGRADAIGTALTFISVAEKVYQKAIEALMNKKITMLPIPKGVELTDNLTADERPIKKDKNPIKGPKFVPKTGAFHEKKDKNKKVNLGGKRRQENQKRKSANYIKKMK